MKKIAMVAAVLMLGAPVFAAGDAAAPGTAHAHYDITTGEVVFDADGTMAISLMSLSGQMLAGGNDLTFRAGKWSGRSNHDKQPGALQTIGGQFRHRQNEKSIAHQREAQPHHPIITPGLATVCLQM